MRNILIDYILSHTPRSVCARTKLVMLSDEALLLRYNEVRDTVESILAV